VIARPFPKAHIIPSKAYCGKNKLTEYIVTDCKMFESHLLLMLAFEEKGK
jgi:hypothetical protein